MEGISVHPKVDFATGYHGQAGQAGHPDQLGQLAAGNALTPPRVERATAGWIQSLSRRGAWIGAVGGVVVGLGGRVATRTKAYAYSAVSGNYPSKQTYDTARAICRAGPTNPVAKVINNVMQPMTKGGLKYVPVALPVLFIGGKVLVKTYREAADWKVASFWTAFKNQVSQVPTQQIVQVVAITALAAGSAVLQSSWVGEVPSWLIGTSDPSGHVMMVTAMGVAMSTAASLLDEAGHSTASAAASLTSLVMGVANGIFLNHTVGYCHSAFEVYDGVKWAVAVLSVGALVSRVPSAMHAIYSKVFG